MTINFNVKVDRKIMFNGQEYSSVDQLPEGMREAYRKAVGGDGKVVFKSSGMKIVFNGKEYHKVEDMPEAERRVYEQALAAVPGRQTISGADMSDNVVDLLRVADKRIGLLRWLFPRKLMQWVEPAVVRSAKYEVEKKRMGKLVPVIVILSCLGIFVLGRIQPAMDMKPLYMTVLCVIGILFIILYANKVTPGTISITDKAIAHNCGDNASFWNFDQIDRCEISNMNTSGGVQPMLVIHTNKGKRTVFGIDSSINTNDLRLLLESKGVKVVI